MEKRWIVAVSQLKVSWMIQWVTELTELAGVGSECGWREGEWEGGRAGKDGWWMVLIQEEAASLYLGSTSQTCRGDGWAVSPLFMDHLPSPICPKNQNHSKNSFNLFQSLSFHLWLSPLYFSDVFCFFFSIQVVKKKVDKLFKLWFANAVKYDFFMWWITVDNGMRLSRLSRWSEGRWREEGRRKRKGKNEI